MDLSGKVAFVTGGSRGIGAGIVRGLAARGAKVVVNYVADPDNRNRADAETVAHEARNAIVVEADVADHARVGTAMRAAIEHFGGIDILVNNAGILRDRTIRKMTAEDFDVVLRVNLGGAFNTIQHASTLLRPEGRIVNIASVAGFAGFFGQANYAPSKAAIVSLTKVAAREFARQRTTANCVAPGFVDTGILGEMPEDVLGKFLDQIPIGRIGHIDDIVNAVLFLCAPQSGYITGQTIHVNGGFWM